MAIQISSGGIPPVQPTDRFYTDPTVQKTTAVTPPPPPPPPPPPKDVVQLSLAANVQRLQSLGDTQTEIAQTLGISEQTVSIELGTSFIEAAISSAPTLQESARS